MIVALKSRIARPGHTVANWAFWIYEADNSYVDDGSSPTISGTFLLEIRDGNPNLQATETSDLGGAQRIFFEGVRIDSYEFSMTIPF